MQLTDEQKQEIKTSHEAIANKLGLHADDVMLNIEYSFATQNRTRAELLRDHPEYSKLEDLTDEEYKTKENMAYNACIDRIKYSVGLVHEQKHASSFESFDGALDLLQKKLALEKKVDALKAKKYRSLEDLNELMTCIGQAMEINKQEKVIPDEALFTSK